MAVSVTIENEKTTWIYTFVILLFASTAMLLLRLSGEPFLVLEFEIAIIYLPTVLSGIIVVYLLVKRPK